MISCYMYNNTKNQVCVVMRTNKDLEFSSYISR